MDSCTTITFKNHQLESGDIIEFSDNGKLVRALITSVDSTHTITIKRFKTIFHWLWFKLSKWFTNLVQLAMTVKLCL